MGKGKGHQAGCFDSKSMRFQYQKELQHQVWKHRHCQTLKRREEDDRRRRKQRNHERPRVRLQSLRGILEERSHDDRMEHRAWRQRSSFSSSFSSSSFSSSSFSSSSSSFYPSSLTNHWSKRAWRSCHGRRRREECYGWIFSSSDGGTAPAAASASAAPHFHRDEEEEEYDDDVGDYDDDIDDDIDDHHHGDAMLWRAFQNRKMMNEKSNASSCASSYFHSDGGRGRRIRTSRRIRIGGRDNVPSLQSMCLEALAPVLGRYTKALGRDVVHRYMNSIPSSKSLERLSIMVSLQKNNANPTRNGTKTRQNERGIGMTNELLHVLGHHSHVQSLCLVGPDPPCDDHDDDEEEEDDDDEDQDAPRNSSISDGKEEHGEDDPYDSRALNDAGLVHQLIPRWGFSQDVPDSWEARDDDEDDEDDEQNDQVFLHDGHGQDDDDDGGGGGEDIEGREDGVGVGVGAGAGEEKHESLSEKQTQHPKQPPSSARLSSSPSMSSSLTRCLRLKRLELGNLCHLAPETLEEILSNCGRHSLTHLSLVHSLTMETGPDVLRTLARSSSSSSSSLSSDSHPSLSFSPSSSSSSSSSSLYLPHLRVLDVSYCSWVTEALLRNFVVTHNRGRGRRATLHTPAPTVADDARRRPPRAAISPPPILVRAVGCSLLPTEEVALEMDFPRQFWMTPPPAPPPAPPSSSSPSSSSLRYSKASSSSSSSSTRSSSLTAAMAAAPRHYHPR